jgi:hypothetical protein
MTFVLKTAVLSLGVLSAATLGAQDISKWTSFTVDGKSVQFHGFVSQGFAYSNDNNYLTMDTNNGSFAMTDGAVNVSTQLTDKFRVGAQFYDRILGNLSRGHVKLDWAVADYRFTKWFGVRGGKVKTVFGLYNDTQDMDFLHTFAILPQSMYPEDLRSSTIAHEGGDLYGDIPVKRLGTFSYTAFGGIRPYDHDDGFLYFLREIGIGVDNYSGPMAGGDLRWATPVKGLLAGASWLTQHPQGTGPNHASEESKKNQISQFYVQYTLGDLRIDGEYRRDFRDQLVGGVLALPGAPAVARVSAIDWDSRGWYGAAAYRISKRVEMGTYFSWFIPSWGNSWAADINHIYDKVATVRFDLTRNWNVKVEQHFMDGYGAIDSARGFYNPPGVSPGPTVTTFQPKTNMVVVRTGWNF